MKKEITNIELKKFKEDFNKNKVNKIVKNAVEKNGIFNTAYNSDALKDLRPIFSIEVKDTGDVTNQKQSGRCWMFAGLNVLRKILIKNLKVDDIELSESYLMFYDKLEKCNYELEAALEHIDEEDNSRLMDIIVSLGGQMDGGFWHFFVNLVKKYGVCPKDVMGETISSSASSEMDDVLNTLVTKDVTIIRNEYKAGKSIEEIKTLKEGMLNEIYRILAISIGEPIENFVFEYKETKKDDKKEDDNKENKEVKEENNFRRIESTPIEFFNKYIGTDLDDYFVLVNWPIKTYPMFRPYSPKLTQNVKEAPLGVAINLPIEEIKKVTIESLKNNDLCWFACDVGASSMRKEGLLSTELLPLGELFSVNLKFDKGDRLMLRASQCTHAMTLSGVNLDSNNKPNRWKVTNSWGSDVGFKGQYVMSDDWFNEYVYEVVVNKKYLTKEILEAANKEVFYLEPWAPVNNF